MKIEAVRNGIRITGTVAKVGEFYFMYQKGIWPKYQQSLKFQEYATKTKLYSQIIKGDLLVAITNYDHFQLAMSIADQLGIIDLPTWDDLKCQSKNQISPTNSFDS